jgi:hypothetical protein
MTTLRSPVDEAVTFEGLSGSVGIDSAGDIMEQLESLRRQGSESDITFSGSSSDEDEGLQTSRDVYLQYVASRGLGEAGKDVTVDSGMRELSSTATSSQQPESSPLGTLERLGSMEGSFASESERQGSEPCRVPSLEDLPPPPPFLRQPRGSTSSTSSLEVAAAAAVMVPSLTQHRGSIDPLLDLERHDPCDMAYTTSESESDFDEEMETRKLRRRLPECQGAEGGVEEEEREEEGEEDSRVRRGVVFPSHEPDPPRHGS